MELDEIKKTWNDLNDRLEKTEKLNKQLISDMLNSKQQTSMEKLKKYELSFLIFSLVFVFITLAEYYMHIFNLNTSLLFEFIFVTSAIWQAYKMYLLSQMKIEKCTTTELLQKALRFKVITRMRTIFGLLLLIPFFIILFFIDERMSTPPMLYAVIIGGSIGLIIGMYFFFKNLKDIDSLIKNYRDIEKHEEN